MIQNNVSRWNKRRKIILHGPTTGNPYLQNCNCLTSLNSDGWQREILVCGLWQTMPCNLCTYEVHSIGNTIKCVLYYLSILFILVRRHLWWTKSIFISTVCFHKIHCSLYTPPRRWFWIIQNVSGGGMVIIEGGALQVELWKLEHDHINIAVVRRYKNKSLNKSKVQHRIRENTSKWYSVKKPMPT